jgi:hypothetical protein
LSIRQVNQEEEGKNGFPVPMVNNDTDVQPSAQKKKTGIFIGLSLFKNYSSASFSILRYSNQYFQSIKTGMIYIFSISGIGPNYLINTFMPMECCILLLK